VPKVDRAGSSNDVFAIAKKQIVHLTDEWDGDGLGVEIDNDPYTIPISALAQRDRRRLERAWNARTCLCPVCATATA
jgi:hypothetical protein